MPLPLLGAGIGKALVVGTAKAAVVGAKVGAKAAVSSGKFFAKGGASLARGSASLARGGARVARQGGRQVVKGAKFFKKKVGGVKRKGGEISKKLKENATNLRDSLKKGNKNQEKLRVKRVERKKKKASIEKKREKEKELESKKSTSGSKNILSGLAKSPLSIFNKLFAFGGLLLGGILINATKGLIDKGKKFMEDNKELFDTIGNFLSGIKDAAVGFFDSITGPESEKGAFDDFAKFDDLGNLESGKLKDVENIYNGFGELINKIDKAMGGEGTAGNALIADKKVLAEKGGKEGVLNQTTDEFQEMKFTKEQRQRYEQTKSGVKPDTVTEDKPDVPLEMKKGHYYFPLPNGQFSGESGQYYGAGRSYGGHAGIDLTESPPFGSKANIDVVAMVGGKVIGDKYLAGKKYMSGMMIKGNDGYDQRYLHMTPMVSIGDSVKAGQKIGELVDMTNVTGNIDETHLHFEVYKRGQGGHLSPHKAYPQFFGAPRSAPKSLDTREKASGGRVFRSIENSKKDMMTSLINQPMDDEGGETIFIQRVNNIQYIPIPVTA
jgi:murein DD-endopeptidase MepM/ murein hydrolase activator NlpD